MKSNNYAKECAKVLVKVVTNKCYGDTVHTFNLDKLCGFYNGELDDAIEYLVSNKKAELNKNKLTIYGAE